jgi:hypothetical protein
MHASNVIARAWVAAVLTAMVPMGCGPSTAGPDSAEKFKMGQVSQLFRIFKKMEKLPQKIKDVESMNGNLPAAVGAIKSKEVLIYWGAGVSDAPEAASTVLAYHKDVPEKGGEVLMQNGKLRKMTAAEFNSAPKPAGGRIDEDAVTDKK